MLCAESDKQRENSRYNNAVPRYVKGANENCHKQTYRLNA